MTKKSATVSVRINPEIKAEAEAILKKLGLPVSVVIDALYRQIVLFGGIPESMKNFKAKNVEDMSEEEFDAMMKIGHEEIIGGETESAKDAFEELLKELRP